MDEVADAARAFDVVSTTCVPYSTAEHIVWNTRLRIILHGLTTMVHTVLEHHNETNHVLAHH